MNKTPHFVIIILVFAGLSLASCGQKKQTDKTTAEVEVTPGKVTPLDIDSFRDLVWDFQAEPTKFIYKGSKPCVIDFYADWCKPCRVASPAIEELAAKYKDEIIFYKINTDNEKELAMLFKVNTIPAFLHIPMKGEPKFNYGILPTPELTLRMFDDKIREYIYGETPDSTTNKL
ncbi:MAG TPA: thiol reductase thioredoxin [Bacteroidales bacterium]|nr:MAG: hypothetical protein A2X11_08480 [Bacteroidetes bacterium GWE2_42_24]OFY30958.1 MAG: hypothetical protein A2X09_17255 [Bacteroidetes bacterium GWF2_43_11]HBZ66458.1 thiol reductase thioredoxin [Bacteroidales bacterium]